MLRIYCHNIQTLIFPCSANYIVYARFEGFKTFCTFLYALFLWVSALMSQTHVIFFPTKNSTFAEATLPFQLHTLVKHAQYCNHAVQGIVVCTV